MLFAVVFDHNDATGRPAGRQLDERLELVAAYERLGYYAYQLTNGRLVLGVGRGVSPVETTAGISYFSLEFAFGDMTSAEVLRSAELFATEVMPAFR